MIALALMSPLLFLALLLVLQRVEEAVFPPRANPGRTRRAHVPPARPFRPARHPPTAVAGGRQLREQHDPGDQLQRANVTS